MEMKYIINAGDYPGHIQSVLKADGTVAYTDGQTLAEYKVERGDDFRIVTGDELDKIIATYEASLVTNPKRITQGRWWEMLEVLPPCRWHHCQGVEFFHISERLTGNLVAWFAKRKGRYYEFTDLDNLPSEDLVNKWK